MIEPEEAVLFARRFACLKYFPSKNPAALAEVGLIFAYCRDLEEAENLWRAIKSSCTEWEGIRQIERVAAAVCSPIHRDTTATDEQRWDQTPAYQAEQRIQEEAARIFGSMPPGLRRRWMEYARAEYIARVGKDHGSAQRPHLDANAAAMVDHIITAHLRTGEPLPAGLNLP